MVKTKEKPMLIHFRALNYSNANLNRLLLDLVLARTLNSTYPKGGVSCSKDSFVVKGTLVFQIKFCGESPALRVAANRYLQPMTTKTTQTT